MSNLELAGFWERIDVSDWPIYGTEPGGTHEPVWLLDASGTGTRWLHKNTTIHPDREQGEDWAEVVATQVGVQLGVPVAATRLCIRNGRRGSLSRNVVPDGFALVEGGLVLESAPHVTNYFPHREGEPPARDPQRPWVSRPGHSLENIHRALRGSIAPPSFTGPDNMDAFDVFAGYLVFDALVANQDRHEENWSEVWPLLTTLAPQLCPSYDHSSSLGFAEPAAKTAHRVKDPHALEAWARRGTARRFEHEGNPQPLVQLAADAMAIASPEAQSHWQRRIREIELTAITAPLASGVIPEMSEHTTRFVIALLELNLERIRHELGSHH
ncbi:hypothetical protein [Brachybacterium paraconglomeratum]|uniref:hypothetical protein n=1 Tax=Brachybacterium paraconglomeratum TaxID=173362 RepID=UPI00223B3766|nr:hypothetical protein [Brachybacterium paraconglomeratum]MCT1438423.1 hypothetical protein [Brachybacterium paraconglomeratum]